MIDPASNAQEEARGDKTPKDAATFWQVQLSLADRDQKDWVEDARAVQARYRVEQKAAGRRDGKRFNILYSNTETLKAALYGRTAKPDVRRRFADANPVARQAAELIERGLIYCADAYDVDRCVERGLHDYLLPGRGVVWLEYEPVLGEQPKIDPVTAQPVAGKDGKPLMQEALVDQELREKYVYWEDYRQSPARTWDDVWWIARRHLMGRDDLVDNFGGGVGNAVPLNWSPSIDRKDIPDNLKKAEVWEIWDKRKRERIWIVPGFDRPCRVDDDPYGLEDFFPCPAPLTAVEDTQTLIPTPEFHTYRDQADDLDEVTARISRLTRALKRRGVYNAAIKELKRLARAGDNEFIPVENWAAFGQQGGLDAGFATEDITVIATVLKELYAQRDMLVQGIYEITGIADILRGATDPNETLGAQQLKAQFGSARMKRRQRAVQKWIRDLYKLKAEILAEHFEPHVLQEMTGIQVTPELLQLIRSDKLRSYHIDIETDSTVFEDAETVKQQTVEVMTAIGTFLKEAVPATQAAPELAPLLFEMLSVGVRQFKQGRQLEDVIEQTKQAVQQKLQQPQQPAADPAEMAKIENDKQRVEIDKFKAAKEAEEKDRRFALDVALAQGDANAKQDEMVLRQRELNDRSILEREKLADVKQGRRETIEAEGLRVRAKQTETGEETTEVVSAEDVRTEQTNAVLAGVADALKELAGGFQQLAKATVAPKRIVRGADGRASHTEMIQ